MYNVHAYMTKSMSAILDGGGGTIPPRAFGCCVGVEAVGGVCTAGGVEDFCCCGAGLAPCVCSNTSTQSHTVQIHIYMQQSNISTCIYMCIHVHVNVYTCISLACSLLFIFSHMFTCLPLSASIVGMNTSNNTTHAIDHTLYYMYQMLYINVYMYMYMYAHACTVQVCQTYM